MNEQRSALAEQGTKREKVIYTTRFSNAEDRVRSETWEVLCSDFFQKFIPENATVVDVGAGDGNFIKNIKAKKKIALDLSEHVTALEAHGVEVIQQPASASSKYIKDPVDIVFMSNFLEHLPTKEILLDVLEDVRLLLKPDGKLLILQPNIRYVGCAYWDYIDHHIALTERSLAEALEVCGFSIETMIPKFLPYTARSSIGHLVGGLSTAQLVSWYLKLPFLWSVFGKQSFVIARPVI